MLAREDPNQPYTYLAHEALHGRRDGVQIDLLLDTLTSKRLAADTDLSVILMRRESTWRSLGIASNSLENVVRSILRHRTRWSTPEGDSHRVRFFMALFGSQEPTLYRLAYIELSRAPYGTIRRFARFVPREQILPMLEDRKFIEWRGLAILLLAGSHHDQDAARIRQALQATQQMQLGAEFSTHVAGFDR